ncbi:HTH domain-containing protein [Streptomyces sp. NPDC005760]|uniref:HTH domain-containing protein n=1 Tax=Streptomyces sp. NPDC005760 TaxID=3156718 RepID=UPI0033F39956
MTRTDRRTLVRQLSEDGLSARAIAQRLKVSKDTVRRDLAALAEEDESAQEPDDEPQNAEAPQVTADAAADGAPSDEPQEAPVDGPASDLWAPGEPEDAPVEELVDEPVEPDAPPRLPRRIRPSEELVIDLSRWPALRRDLAVLEATGLSPEALVNQAVIVLAFGYKQAVSAGRIRPDGPFIVRDMTVSPPVPGPRRAAPARRA